MPQEIDDFEAERNPTQWAREILANPDKYCVLDTETTGLSNAEPVEIAAIGLDGKTLITLRLKPSIPIERGAQQIHGISNADIKDAPTFAQIFADLVWAIGDRTVLIYNAGFDTGVLENACKAYGLTCPSWVIDCVMIPYSEFVGEWNSYHGNYKWQKLPSGDHSALGDCRATLKIIQEMANG